MSAERRARAWGTGLGIFMLLVELRVLWVFVSGTRDEVNDLGELHPRALLHLMAWLKAPAWRPAPLAAYFVFFFAVCVLLALGLVGVGAVRWLKERNLPDENLP